MPYMVTFTINIPPMLPYMAAPWILCPMGFSLWQSDITVPRFNSTCSLLQISPGWWLSHPSDKYESQWEGLSHILLWKIKHVPKHQPVTLVAPVAPEPHQPSHGSSSGQNSLGPVLKKVHGIRIVLAISCPYSRAEHIPCQNSWEISGNCEDPFQVKFVFHTVCQVFLFFWHVRCRLHMFFPKEDPYFQQFLEMS